MTRPVFCPLSKALACALALASTCAPAQGQAGSLTSLFQASAGVQNGGNLFDVVVTRPSGLTITGFDVNLGGLPPPSTFRLDVYVTPVSYWGKDSMPNQWTLVASTSAQPIQPDVPVRVDTGDFYLAPGSYGLALYVTGNGPWYTLPGGAPLAVQNQDLTLRFGLSKPLLFAGGSFSPRVWNGTVYYDAPPPPITTYGVGRTSSLGAGCVPRIGSSGVMSAAAQDGFHVFGWRVPSHQPGLLLYSLNGRADLPFRGGRLRLAPPWRRTVPVDSGGLAPGVNCWGRYELDLAAFGHGVLGGHPAPALCWPGTTVNCQWWARDPGFAPPNDALLSDGLELTVRP